MPLPNAERTRIGGSCAPRSLARQGRRRAAMTEIGWLLTPGGGRPHVGDRDKPRVTPCQGPSVRPARMGRHARHHGSPHPSRTCTNGGWWVRGVSPLTWRRLAAPRRHRDRRPARPSCRPRSAGRAPTCTGSSSRVASAASATSAVSASATIPPDPPRRPGITAVNVRGKQQCLVWLSGVV